MSYTSSDVIVRPARAEDCAFLLQAVERLPEFGPPVWRTPVELVEGEARAVWGYFASPPPGATVFEGNRRARAVYERLGYQAETLRYVKLLERAMAFDLLRTAECAGGKRSR